MSLNRIFRNGTIAITLVVSSIHITPKVAVADDLFLPPSSNLEVTEQNPRRLANNSRQKSLKECNYASQAHASGNAELSLKYYLQAIESDSSNPCPYAGAAIVVHQSGLKDEAINLMQAAVYLAQADGDLELYERAIDWLVNEGVN
jgi:hypothetical protein